LISPFVWSELELLIDKRKLEAFLKDNRILVDWELVPEVWSTAAAAFRQYLGSSAPIDKVLELVYEKMKDRLNEYDLQPLPSSPKQSRWRNTAQWCRKTMVSEGLPKPDSPRGVWEITDAGREQVLEKGAD